jgi:hypothetical protein
MTAKCRYAAAHGERRAWGRSVPDIVNPRGKNFFDHWRNLPRRNGGVIPSSEDYLDQAPAALMAGIFIHEVIDDALVVRFMGTDLVSRWRRDDTGKIFGEHMGLHAQSRLVAVGQAIVGQPCGMVQHGKMETTIGRAAVFEAILLPLAVELGRAPRMVIFSSMLDSLEREEFGRQFSDAGTRNWLDVGAGVPDMPPPPL